MPVTAPSGQPNQASPRYDWPRFWIPQTGILDLSDAGFLRDPEDSLSGRGALHTLTELEGSPALVLLGEPGIGKSTSLTQEHKRVSALPPAQGVRSIYVDLNQFSGEDRLHRSVFESPEIAAWKAGDTKLCLHLDSLDEAMLRIETVPHLLADRIKDLPAERLSLRIACRTAVWPDAILGGMLRDIWGESGLGALELTPLRRQDVRVALAANNIDPDDFIPRLFAAQAVGFAIKPLTLKMLIAQYHRDGRLPASMGDLYRQGCLALCAEQNASRRETRRQGQLNGQQRLRVAGRIAAATLLGGRLAVWTGIEIERPAEDVQLSDFAGAREEGDFVTFVATDDGIKEVLDTGLFTSRGADRMGWAHQTYAEFLAALYLTEKEVRPESILQILTHPGGGLIPQLTAVAAWVASLVPAARAAMIASAPWALLRGDLSSWSPQDLEALVASMLCYVDAGKYYDRFFGMFEAYAKLKHPNLAAQLRAAITDSALLQITRRTALSIAERCALHELQPDLLQLANDAAAEPWLRAGAIAALKPCGDPTVPPQILALMRAGIASDPDDEIRGNALDLLWSAHISSQELFTFLGPANDRHYGSYHHFLRKFPETLPASNLPAALAWATSYLCRAALVNEFYEKTLADAIMFRAWESLDDASVLEALLLHLAARLRQYGELCRGTDYQAQNAFKDSLLRDEPRRRRFLLALCREPNDRNAAFPYVHKGFARSEDLKWLLDISPGGISAVPGLSEETLCHLIELVFNAADDAQFELIYQAAQSWPALRAEFSFLLDPIEIDSNGARQARAQFDQIRALEAHRPSPAIPDLPKAISDLLALAESGDWSAWWRLNIVLNMKPDTPVIMDDLNYFIADMPGWVAADETIRARIIAAATRYLEEAESSADDWVGQNPTPMRSSDIAGLRAFVLLYRVASDRYRQIPADIWENWAPVIVALPRIGSEQRDEELDAILRDALHIAPAAFIATVMKMLHMEMWRARSTGASQQQSAGAPFLILRELAGCWGDDHLKAALFAEMQVVSLTPAEYCAILEPLVAAGYEPAIAHAVSRLATLDGSTLPIAEVLVGASAPAVWPILWPKLNANDELARRFFLSIARDAFGLGMFYANLSADQIADLYVLVERVFPAAFDPEPPSGFVSPRQMVTHFRDGIPEFLVNLATADAIRALQRLAAGPPARPNMLFALSRAEINMRVKTWSPLAPREILAMADRPAARLVTSAAELLEILGENIQSFAAGLHGAQTPVRALWDRQGSTRLFRPIDENGLSDAVSLYLRRELQDRGMFANREVEVTRRPGAPVGRRTDILVNAFRRGAGGEVLDAITAVIEVKGCWNDEVFTGIEAQLVNDYMVNLGASVGIFLVGWFDKTDWDPADYRRGTTPARRSSEVQRELDQQAAAVPEGLRVRAMVLDIRAPGT